MGSTKMYMQLLKNNTKMKVDTRTKISFTISYSMASQKLAKFTIFSNLKEKCHISDKTTILFSGLNLFDKNI